MYLPTVLSFLLATALAAPSKRSVSAILQFEIALDTFTSDAEVNVPGTVTVNEQLIAATIAEVDGTNNIESIFCQAKDANGEKIGDVITIANTTTFNNGNLVEISTIACKD